MINKKYKIKILFLVVFLAIISIFYYKNKVSYNQPVTEIKNIPSTIANSVTSTSLTKSTIQTPKAKTETKIEKPVYLNSTTITISAGDKTISQIFEKGQSLYDVLIQASKNSQLVFSGKEYPGLGFFVTDIGNLHAGGGKNLQYYINGKYASLGVSSYVPVDSDVIVWKLE